MTSDRTHKLGHSVPTESPSLTIGEWIVRLLELGRVWNTFHPGVAMREPCDDCMHWMLSGRTHGLHLQAAEESDGASSSERRLWENVSPDSTFLADHLPAVLPVPGASTSSTPASRTVACQATAGQCPVHNVASGSGVVLGHLHDAPAARRAALHTQDTPSATESVVDSLDGDSIDDTVSDMSDGADSLYASPEQVPLALPAADAQVAPAAAVQEALPAAAAHVQQPPIAVAPPPPVAVIQQPPAAPVAVVAPQPPVVVAPPPPIAVVQQPPAAPVAVVAPQPPVVVAAQQPLAAVAPPPPVAPAAQPAYTPFFAPPSDAPMWYVVTCGKTVGVFDDSAVMVHSTSRVSGGAGRGGFASRDTAISAFRSAEMAGVVKQVRL
ncbi:hypothetical protein K466DRAFT_605775 [Polyporus arcularius HHB13444]|uniref:Uncharacterized protein n=1 Tax=Polyporus arcularius HHB13444 TaxID=1314778 RepID=A0A5C3NSB4_9APHY|nr:hypothetical protein K466DRAFT_605775 [Polyporus arcularius HHB13444]